MSESNRKIAAFRRHEDGITEIYANYISVTWTVYDVRLRLAHVLPAGMKLDGSEDAGFIAEETAGLTLAWAEAKALRDMLTSSIERYEKANGVIVPPKLAE